MNLSELLTDDQLAVLGCLGALAISGVIAAISYHLGPAGKADRQLRIVGEQRRPEVTPVAVETQRRAA